MTEDRAQNWAGGALPEKEKDRLREMLLDSVATEFFQPLNLISLNREYLQMHLERERERFSEEKVNEALASIDCATAQLNRLMNNCLDLMSCLQGRAHPQNVAVDLWALISDLTAKSEEAAQMLHLRLTLEPPPDELICVETDRAMAERILLNLLSNAMRASAPGGQITLSLQKLADGCVLSIHDEGKGVSPAFAAQAFHSIRQEAGTERFCGGAGLGLYLCGEFCRLLGWQPEMRAAKRGTTVSVHIPAGQFAGSGVLIFHSAPMEQMQQQERLRAVVTQELRSVPGLEQLGK